MKTFREYLAEAKIEKQLENELPTDIYSILHDISIINIIDSFSITKSKFEAIISDVDFDNHDLLRMGNLSKKIRLMGGSKPRTIRIIIDL